MVIRPLQVNVGTSGAEIGAAFGGNKVRALPAFPGVLITHFGHFTQLTHRALDGESFKYYH